VTDPLGVALKTAVITRRAARGWRARLRVRVRRIVRVSAAGLRRRRRLGRGRLGRDVFGVRAPTMLVALRRMRTRLLREHVVRRDRGGSVDHRPATPPAGGPISRAAPSSKPIVPETHARNESTFRHVSSRFETYVRNHADSPSRSARRETRVSPQRLEGVKRLDWLERPERPRTSGESHGVLGAAAHVSPAAASVAMTHRKPSPARPLASDTRPLRAARAAELSFGDLADASPRKAGPAPMDIERLTDQVLLKIERRLIAQRERLGLGDL
jgi:hypothetical protein